ncbi:hypothetical protein G3I71_48985, partial [Streptomyces sp. SID12501]|nr:hypothetical protein [Streptomyces sp. SID12501]
GVGLAIQYDSAARRGEPWPGRYGRRAAFLFVEGTVHFLLVFAWDVLMGYAVTAFLVARLLTRSEKVRRRAMWTAGALHLVMVALLTLALVGGSDDSGSSSGSGSGGVDPEVVALYAEGNWFDQIAFRLQNFAALR